MAKQKILLDTDIGDDVDDALALALICACDELDLMGVTTVFGNVLARSRQARTILKVAGERFAQIPVATGCGASLATRPISQRGIDEYLADRLPGQDSTCLPEKQLAPLDPRHGAQFIIDTIMTGDGTIIPVMIGALTNLAVAMTMERRIAAKIPKLAVMAGEFKGSFAEWNIRCDPEAAALVFNSGVPIDLVPFAAGIEASFEQEHLDRLTASTSPLSRLLCATIEAWQGDGGRMPALFDPLAVLTLLHPEFMEWRRGTVRVELRGDATYGYTTFTEDANGPHNVVWEIDREAALDFYFERITTFQHEGA